ncbi:Uma2 family endonuclease [Thermus albus]|uniref:Uma2 family endonuclease n=1 Tax=Thermus albus TaxID=2908146 RepID=UPI001FA989D3|nr:Uma2 family endonuclease [Thermus albus]
MAGASRGHNLLGVALFPKAREKGCRAHGETSKLKVALRRRLLPWPHGGVGSTKGEPLLRGKPLVMEALSPATEAQDRRERMRAYLGLASLQAYPILNPQSKGLEGYIREETGFSLKGYPGGQVPLPCLGIPLDLEALYSALD